MCEENALVVWCRKLLCACAGSRHAAWRFLASITTAPQTARQFDCGRSGSVTVLAEEVHGQWSAHTLPWRRLRCGRSTPVPQLYSQGVVQTDLHNAQVRGSRQSCGKKATLKFTLVSMGTGPSHDIGTSDFMLTSSNGAHSSGPF